MDFSWSEALTIGGTGFGLVFAVLVILAIIITVTGKLLMRYDWAKAEVTKKDQAKAEAARQDGKD
jgi:sodium pump decarboxylase gamma subunit